MWFDPGAPVDSYYEVRPECTDVPKTKFKIKGCTSFNSMFGYVFKNYWLCNYIECGMYVFGYIFKSYLVSTTHL